MSEQIITTKSDLAASIRETFKPLVDEYEIQLNAIRAANARLINERDSLSALNTELVGALEGLLSAVNTTLALNGWADYGERAAAIALLSRCKGESNAQ